MKGDLDLDTYDIILNDVKLVRGWTKLLALTDLAGVVNCTFSTAHLGIVGGTIYPTSPSGFTIQTGATGQVYFKGYDGGALQTVAQIVRAASPRFDVPRAGNITLMLGKHLLGAGVNILGSLGTPFVHAYITDQTMTGNLAGVKKIEFHVYTDLTRGSPISNGRVIYNSDDNGLNIDDGTNWRDTNGNIT